MGILGGSAAKADGVDLRRTFADYVRLLADSEQLIAAYQLNRDTLLFTNRRLIIVGRSMGRKVDYTSIPYRAISLVEVEASGEFDLDADLRIFVAGRTLPVEQQFTRAADVYEVQALLAHMLPS